MKVSFKRIPGSIIAPKGFLAAGVFCDIKKLGTGKGSNKGKKRDLALIVSETPATVAGMFTTSQVCAALVKLCVKRIKKGVAQAIVVNSGNAKMVGWAFAIAAASYFPLLFMSVWWRGMTMRGAATGMLVGGMASLITVVSTMVADQAAWAKPLSEFFATHPLLRILCEQPAIWAVPLAITLMIVVSKLTRKDIPSDVRMKMLVLHAPEKLGLKQEYIQEHQAGH